MCDGRRKVRSEHASPIHAQASSAAVHVEPFLGSFGVIGRVLFLILILRLMDKILHDPYA